VGVCLVKSIVFVCHGDSLKDPLGIGGAVAPIGLFVFEWRVSFEVVSQLFQLLRGLF